LLSPFGILLNIFNIVMCFKRLEAWTIARVGAMNLAICDLLILLSILPLAVNLYFHYNWLMGRFLCFATHTSYFLGLTSNTMFICAISLDRFIAIVFPVRLRWVRTIKNAVITTVGLWLLSLALIALNCSTIVYREDTNHTQFCGVSVFSEQGVSGAIYSLFLYYSIKVIIPLIIVVPCYVLIVINLISFNKRRRRNQEASERAMKQIAAVIANFLVCWTPGHLLEMIGSAIYIAFRTCENICGLTRLFNLLMEISQLLSLVNSCANPLIYHLHYREVFQLLKKNCVNAVNCANICICSTNRKKAPEPSVQLIAVSYITN
uniref:G-protein coupled receptors family 1 profile domain-containing protein n=2 Tax=Latimeria chalumnae TaxID=7897 RepID=H3A8W0_LATCH